MHNRAPSLQGMLRPFKNPVRRTAMKTLRKRRTIFSHMGRLRRSLMQGRALMAWKRSSSSARVRELTTRHTSAVRLMIFQYRCRILQQHGLLSQAHACYGLENAQALQCLRGCCSFKVSSSMRINDRCRQLLGSRKKNARLTESMADAEAVCRHTQA